MHPAAVSCQFTSTWHPTLSLRAYGATNHSGAGDFAIDRPDEACELARDGGDDHGLELSLAGQRPIARVKSMLGLPSDLASRARGGLHPGLLLLSDPRRMSVGPRALDEGASRSPVPGLGDRTALDRVPGRMLRRHQPKIGHQL